MVQGCGRGFQMLLLLSIGFTPLVNGSLDVPQHIFLDKLEEWCTHADRAWLPSASMGSWSWCPLGCCWTDVSGTVLLHPAGLTWTLPGMQAQRKDLHSHHSLWPQVNKWSQGGEGACLPCPASCHLISQPCSPSLCFPASSRREPASPSWTGNSVAETEWVQWFKWSKLDSCQWKRN